MDLERVLCIRRGVTAIIGGGGKTTLMLCLGKELSQRGRVILCTTTHILPDATVACVVPATEHALEQALELNPCVMTGSPADNGKICAPQLPFEALCKHADYVIVEADGSRHCPVKAHAAHEPVIPPLANQTILVIGASAFGQTISSAVHRPEIFCEWTGTQPEDLVTPARISNYVNLEGLHTRVLINQTETARRRRLAKELAGRLKSPACMASLKEGWIQCLF